MSRILSICFCCMISFSVQGADHCVRSGASGTQSGSDWVNAYTNLPTTLVRGDRYYIAGGDYGKYVFGDEPSGTNWIYVTKATVAAHGAATGWSDSYASTANFTELKFDRSYYDVDGVTGTNNSGHGIKITHTVAAAGYGGAWSDNFQYWKKHHIRLAHIEITQAAPFEQDGIYFYLCETNATIADPNLLVESCYIHNQGGLHGHFLNGSYQVFRNNFMEFSSQTDSSGHKEMMKWDSTNSFVRIYGNTFKDWRGFSVTGGLILGGGGIAGSMTDWLIYNNIFYWTTISNPGGTNTWSGGNRSIGGLDSSTTDHSDVYVFNNTFYNVSEANAANIFSFGVWTGNRGVTNNLFSVCAGLSEIRFASNYNAFYQTANWTARAANDVSLSSDPTPNAATGDFQLAVGSAAIGSGANLNSYFTTDKNGTTRGSTWDIGAYQYAATASTNTTGRITYQGQAVKHGGYRVGF